MKFNRIAGIAVAQDGAIWDGKLFRIDALGNTTVYDLSTVADSAAPLATFTLDKREIICPHSNSVCFGTKYFAEGDKYPLLYSNVYNNYAKSEDKRIGVTCVYRIEESDGGFKSTLVQLIEIGFTEDVELWRATPEAHGVRPYGNFLVDPDDGSFWAYTMVNEERGTRYFRFDTPDVCEGELDEVTGVRRAVLTREDIRDSFDGSYARFIQGGIIHDGKLYSVEGFTSAPNLPTMRIVDLCAKSEEVYNLTELGIFEEPELIAFFDGVCYYSDWRGNLFTVEF